MESSFWFDAVDLEWSTIYIEGHRLFLFLNIAFVIANTVEIDEKKSAKIRKRYNQIK